MKITFTGWSREVYSHPHVLKPLSSQYARTAGKSGSPLKWSSALEVSAKIEDVSLGGEYRMLFEFEEDELRNWLSKYVSDEPEAALRLLAEMQAEAHIAFVRSVAEGEAEEND